VTASAALSGTAGSGAPVGAGRLGALADAAAILRLHITLIGALGALTFGWLLTGRYLVVVAVVAGVDWLLINLVNRVTDLVEDARNGIRGTAWIAARPRRWAGLAFAGLIASFALTHAIAPALTPWRALVQAIGLAYSYRWVPTPRGLRRWKDLYFFKNAMSAGLFLLTGFAYPLALAGGPGSAFAGAATAVWLGVFFFLFEQSYEVIYDLRDLDGDRAANVPTYPVVHGAETGGRIVFGLSAASSAVLAAGLATGGLGAREGLLLAAPLIQALWFRPRFRRAITSRECIALTHLGSLLLVAYLAGTRIWLVVGLPSNWALVG
jgi:4-hydroxybenzoate polyprenyltransferase